MRPQWFSTAEVPFESMWKDDPFWFPFFLQNKKFKGKFTFDADDNVKEYTLQEVKNLS